MIRSRDCAAAQAVLTGAGFSAEFMPNDIIAVTDEVALERSDDIATRLVKASQPPTVLDIEQEELEHYFLRLVGIAKENPL